MQRSAYLSQELPGDIDGSETDDWGDDESTGSVSLNPRNRVEGIDAWFKDIE